MSPLWWHTNPKDIFALTLTLCACAKCIGSKVIWFTWVKPNPKCSNVFIQVCNICFTRYITPNFIGHSFRTEGETCYFFANSPLCTFILSQIYFCVFMQVKHLQWNFCHGAELCLAGPDSGLSLSKYFGPTSGLHTKHFYNMKSYDFFLLWRRLALTAVTSVSEVTVIFLQLILSANTAAFFYYLLGLVSHAGFRLQTESFLQLCVGMWARANRGRLKVYVLHPPTGKIDWNHFVK